ncbi:hypothetical protein V5O48_005418 [Marasmius crinis-equi]|uniref:Uncharacterized protein n=1 Tax=Marasmius crinis-equi TaxID=585013 RepID=A0ABR3FN85_9AGAR
MGNDRNDAPHTRNVHAAIDRDMSIFHQIIFSSPLTSLDLCRFSFGKVQDFLDFFTSLPDTLSQLKLISCRLPPYNDRFLQKLTLSNHEGSGVLPHLTVLDLSNTLLEFNDASLLLTMVESRWRVEESQEQKRLSRVHFTWTEEQNHIVSSRLAAFADEGLRVEVTIALDNLAIYRPFEVL